MDGAHGGTRRKRIAVPYPHCPGLLAGLRPTGRKTTFSSRRPAAISEP
ncbi:hypothetical protein CSE45_3496 [Citreicella sp. SE45]|nr:hypothetical protein CSE45_3496 [Citreicella sp. SE45]